MTIYPKGGGRHGHHTQHAELCSDRHSAQLAVGLCHRIWWGDLHLWDIRVQGDADYPDHHADCCGPDPLGSGSYRCEWQHQTAQRACERERLAHDHRRSPRWPRRHLPGFAHGHGAGRLLRRPPAVRCHSDRYDQCDGDGRLVACGLIPLQPVSGRGDRLSADRCHVPAAVWRRRHPDAVRADESGL